MVECTVKSIYIYIEIALIDFKKLQLKLNYFTFSGSSIKRCSQSQCTRDGLWSE